MRDDPQSSSNTAGGSARREYERRRANREQRTREKHPHIGGILLTLRDPPQQEMAWASGAEAEVAVAESLARRCPDAIVLHDRQMPRSRANIDHIAIAPSGVYVIDTKRYSGKIEVRRPLFGKTQLRINGRDKTKLVDGLTKQVGAVETAVGAIAPGISIHSCFCFVAPRGLLADSGLPMLGTPSIASHDLVYPRKLAKRLQKSGPLGDEERRLVAEQLERQFPPA